MDPLPDERYVTMRLYYNATCPEEYEPHSFRKAEAVDLQYVRFNLATALAIWIEIGHAAYPHAPTRMEDAATLTLPPPKTFVHEFNLPSYSSTETRRALRIFDCIPVQGGAPSTSSRQHQNRVT
jgi:hypothetical protein